MRELAHEAVGIEMVDIWWCLQVRCLVRLFFSGSGNVQDAVDGFRIAFLGRIRRRRCWCGGFFCCACLSGCGWTGCCCWRIFLYFFVFVNGVLRGFLVGHRLLFLRLFRRLLVQCWSCVLICFPISLCARWLRSAGRSCEMTACLSRAGNRWRRTLFCYRRAYS